MFPSPEEVCNLAILKFNDLPKTGKPTSKEWTILSAVILYNHSTKTSKVVSLGTGTRSIPSSKYCKLGLIVNDSHAEVIAKRSFQWFLYNEIRKSGGIFKFNTDSKTFDLQAGISFHFYTSQVPCGDACIVVESGEPEAKRRKAEEIFTGAKLLSDCEDKMSQEVGAVRLKPGKGEQTLSMSCSDKIARWNVLGLQGSLLDSLLSKPVTFKTFNLSCEYDQEAVERAVWKRFDGDIDLGGRFVVNHPTVRRGQGISFEFSCDKKKSPCPNTIAWSDVGERSLQVSVNGKRLGVGKKQFYNKKSSLDICRRLLFENFVDLVSSDRGLLDKFALEKDTLSKMSYREVKALSKDYQDALTHAKKKLFKQWVEKDLELTGFNVNSEYFDVGQTSHSKLRF